MKRSYAKHQYSGRQPNRKRSRAALRHHYGVEKQFLFITKVSDDNITQEQNFEADVDLEENDVGDQSSVTHKDNTLLEDLKPSIDTSQESLSSARLELAECNIDCVCRLCGTKLRQEECTLSYNNVFCYNYPEMILSCTSLEVVQGDGLPHKICGQCITNLNMAYHFRKVCIETCNIFMRSTFNRSSKTNSTDSTAYTEIAPVEIVPTGIVDKIDYRKEKQTKLRLGAKRKEYVPPEARLCLAESHKNSTPVGKDTVGDCLDNNTDGLYKQNKNEGFCNDINITEIHGDIGSTHSDDKNWLENQLEEEETEKPLIIFSYPSNTKENIFRAKTEIRKFCCPKLKRGGMGVLCPFCPAMFDVELYNEIQQHLDSHIHIESRYVCRYDNCNETFQTNMSRKIHQNTDHGTQKLKMRKKPCKWLCDHCAIMIRPYHYELHIDRKKHMLRKVYFCDECSFRTNCKSRIRQHIEGLHNSKRIRCKLCDKMIPLNKVWSHIANQHEAKIPCKYCNKEFLRRNINGHLRTHTGEKPFSCSDCRMEFTFKVSLKTHRKRYHGDDMFKGTT